jgi:hypothetical protein
MSPGILLVVREEWHSRHIKYKVLRTSIFGLFEPCGS